MKALLKSLFQRKEKSPILQVRRRSVVFLNHSYYHFYYLSKALRRRGWDVVTASYEHPDSPSASFYHGVDVELHHPDPLVWRRQIDDFFTQALGRFRLMHFAGDGYLSFRPWSVEDSDPPDIVEWRSAGHRIAYTSSGCSSATAQSSVGKWSGSLGAVSVCDRCVWQHRPDVCSDARNLAWGRKISRFCDLIFTEALPALDYMKSGPRVIREPVATALDPEVWEPGLQIPPEFRAEKREGEILIYHGVGNYETRDKEGRNIKGTPAVFAAVERLRTEGHSVRLQFVTSLKSIDVRYVQVQADIIIDQLNYGRYGATAREGMMLGKPVICYINPREYSAADELECLKETPLVSASEESLYEVLKDLVLNPAKRQAIGEQSRRYAMKWHSDDACAERYERIYDQLMARPAHPGPYSETE